LQQPASKFIAIESPCEDGMWPANSEMEAEGSCITMDLLDENSCMTAAANLLQTTNDRCAHNGHACGVKHTAKATSGARNAGVACGV